MDRIERKIRNQEKVKKIVEQAKEFAEKNEMNDAELIDAIKNSRTKDELNNLRMLVVISRRNDILVLWQKQYKSKK